MTVDFVMAQRPNEFFKPNQQVRFPTDDGDRIVDRLFRPKSGKSALLVEVKSGGTKNGGHAGVERQVRKDLYLLQNQAPYGDLVVGEVQWHFWPGYDGRMASATAIQEAALAGDVWVHYPNKSTAKNSEPNAERAGGHQSRVERLGGEVGTPVALPTSQLQPIPSSGSGAVPPSVGNSMAPSLGAVQGNGGAGAIVTQLRPRSSGCKCSTAA